MRRDIECRHGVLMLLSSRRSLPASMMALAWRTWRVRRDIECRHGVLMLLSSRRSLPASMMGIGLEDLESEEGHNADNESLASYLSGALGAFPDNDHIPTRDTG